MLDLVAISFVTLGGLLLITGLFIVMFNLLVEVLSEKETVIGTTMNRYIVAGVFIGVMFILAGCTLHGIDGALKLS